MSPDSHMKLVAMQYLKIDFFLRSHALLGSWPNLETVSNEKTQRRRASTKRQVIFDDFENDVEQDVVKSRPTRKSNRKVPKSYRGKNGKAQNDLSSETSLKIVEAEEEDESFLLHFKDSIKVKRPLKIDDVQSRIEYQTMGSRPSGFGEHSVSKPFKN